jgi:hypothetical protein
MLLSYSYYTRTMTRPTQKAETDFGLSGYSKSGEVVDHVTEVKHAKKVQCGSLHY